MKLQPSYIKLRLITRSIRPEFFYKKAVLRNLAKLAGKHLYQSLFFNKVAGLRPATLLKKRLWHRFFSCEFCKISRNTFSYRTPPVLASRLLNPQKSNNLYYHTNFTIQTVNLTIIHVQMFYTKRSTNVACHALVIS